ncbi:MAG: DinB family protein [Dehalococcoidia bacterium]
MGRTAIETLLHMMEVAYRADPFSSLRRNLDSVRDDEWEIRPAKWSIDEFGTQPELSIGDLVLHIGGPKRMYADRAFGDCTLEWATIPRPSAFDRESVIAWLDEGHRLLADGLAALTDDAELAVERPAPWRAPMARQQLITIMISHDLYHSGEINRQRALIRGAEGWSLPAS